MAGVGAVPVTSTVPSHAVDVVAHQRQGIGRNEMTQILARERGVAAKLPRASGAPPALRATVADSPPMKPHEEFGFVPYWTLDQATSFDVTDLTTIAYFSLGVNADGTIQEAGTGWDGYESQPFADLVARAHAAGDRVVLTVSCFSQSALDALTSSPAAAVTLARQAVADMEAKHLDGVNLDLEGEGPADRAGLTALAATVSRAVHAVNPHDQVTMDTYGSSAADPNGFYDIAALAKVVDGFFVMAYDLNFDGAPTQGSAMTSTEFPDALAASQYAAVVPPVKVIVGESFYGLEWPTSNGTLDASATGPPTPVSYAQVVSSGAPLYWDRVTQTAWTSYEQGGQWHEAYFEDPESIYLLSQLARRCRRWWRWWRRRGRLRCPPPPFRGAAPPPPPPVRVRHRRVGARDAGRRPADARGRRRGDTGDRDRGDRSVVDAAFLRRLSRPRRGARRVGLEGPQRGAPFRAGGKRYLAAHDHRVDLVWVDRVHDDDHGRPGDLPVLGRRRGPDRHTAQGRRRPAPLGDPDARGDPDVVPDRRPLGRLPGAHTGADGRVAVRGQPRRRGDRPHARPVRHSLLRAPRLRRPRSGVAHELVRPVARRSGL